MTKKILIADSDTEYVQGLSSKLSEKGFQCVRSLTGKDAQQQLTKEKFNAVILNYGIEDYSAFEVLNFIKSTNPYLFVYFLFDSKNDLDSSQITRKKKQLGLADIFVKEDPDNKLLATLSKIDNSLLAEEDFASALGLQNNNSQEVVDIEDSDFFSFNVDLLSGDGLATFDTYIRLSSSRYILFIRQGEIISSERVSKFAKSNEKYLYYKWTDRQELIKNLNSELKKTIPHIIQDSGKVTSLLNHSMNLLYDEISKNGPQPEVLKISREMIERTQEVIRTIPDLQALIDEFFLNHDNLKKHSLLSTIFTGIICENLGWMSPKIADEICLGAFLQNIGLAKINEDRAWISEDMESEEIESYKKHPIAAYRFLQHYPVSEKVRQIILQHHESFDGTGYPFGLRQTKIYPPAKVVFLASELVESMIINKLSPKDAMTKIVQDPQKRLRYDPEIVKALITGFIKK